MNFEYKKDTCVVRYQAYTCVVSNFIPELICYLIVQRVLIITEKKKIATEKYKYFRMGLKKALEDMLKNQQDMQGAGSLCNCGKIFFYYVTI